MQVKVSHELNKLVVNFRLVLELCLNEVDIGHSIVDVSLRYFV